MTLKKLSMAALHLLSMALFLLSMAWLNPAAAADQPAADQPASQSSNADPVSVGNAQFQIAPVSDAWRNGLPRDADAATKAYLDRLSPAVVARANNYFEGGYWLQLWNFLLGLLISFILLYGKRAAQVRDWAQRVGRKAFFRDALFGAFFRWPVLYCRCRCRFIRVSCANMLTAWPTRLSCHGLSNS
jgi:STE24 endopeptidase